MITDDEARENIAANLRRIMAARGMSQRELAEKTHRPVMTINRLYRGEYEPKVSLIANVAEVLGFSIETLLATPPRTAPIETSNSTARNSLIPA